MGKREKREQKDVETSSSSSSSDESSVEEKIMKNKEKKIMDNKKNESRSDNSSSSGSSSDSTSESSSSESEDEKEKKPKKQRLNEDKVVAAKSNEATSNGIGFSFGFDKAINESAGDASANNNAKMEMKVTTSSEPVVGNNPFLRNIFLTSLAKPETREFSLTANFGVGIIESDQQENDNETVEDAIFKMENKQQLGVVSAIKQTLESRPVWKIHDEMQQLLNNNMKELATYSSSFKRNKSENDIIEEWRAVKTEMRRISALRKRRAFKHASAT